MKTNRVRVLTGCVLIMIGGLLMWKLRQASTYRRINDDSLLTPDELSIQGHDNARVESHLSDNAGVAEPKTLSNSSRLDSATHGNSLNLNPLGFSTNGKLAARSASHARRLLEQLNDEKISFYGLAMDQDGRPLAGATAHAVVIENRGEGVKYATFEAHSDSNGWFEFQELVGETIIVGVSKLPEYRDDIAREFNYSSMYGDQKYLPDPNSREVFKLSKRMGTAKLFSYRFSYKIPATQAPVQLNLLNGAVVESGGDLVIQLLLGTNHNPYTNAVWRANLEFPGGGWIDARKPLDFLVAAPAAGYSPKMGLTGETNAYRKQLTPTDGRFCYLRLRDGLIYAKALIELTTFGAENGDAGLTIELTYNPNGSVILEPDKMVSRQIVRKGDPPPEE